MPAVLQFPTQHTAMPQPKTAEEWQKAIAVAAERTVLLQMKGADSAQARAEFEQLVRSAPPEVQATLQREIQVGEVVDIAHKGVKFFQAVWDLWKRF